MISAILFLDLLFLICLLVFTGFLLIKLFFSLFIIFGAPFVPAPIEKVRKMLELASPKQGEILYDLGSGDAKILIEAARKYNVKCNGIEINPVLVRMSARRIEKLGLQNKIKIHQGNFFKKDFSDADVILIYLFQPTMVLLERKFLSELKPGTRIVSLAFTFDNIPFIKSLPDYPYIRLYEIPTVDRIK